MLIAVQFLTRLPVRLPGEIDASLISRSLLFYPLVGALLGALLAALGLLLGNAPAGVQAALVLAAWVLITGALHLDGLADSADAWLGGHGDRERTLAIMKDPYSGPAGVVLLVLVLLGKFAALEAVLPTGQWLALLGVPLLARAMVPVLFLTTPYVRPGGLGAALSEQGEFRAGLWLVVGLSLSLALLVQGFAALLAALAMFWLLRWLMLQRLGGTTGDTAGAMIEIIETAALLALALG